MLMTSSERAVERAAQAKRWQTAVRSGPTFSECTMAGHSVRSTHRPDDYRGDRDGPGSRGQVQSDTAVSGLEGS